VLNIWILNVGHGDSIVLEHVKGEYKSFAVIDSNRLPGQVSVSAFRKLEQLNADSLSFVALTHPHADHYRGLFDILTGYKDRISNFFIYPVGIDIQRRLKNLAKIHQRLHQNTESQTLKNDTTEFLKILLFLKENIGLNSCEELNGPNSQFIPDDGFEDVEFFSIAPPRSVKGEYFQLIDKNNLDLINGKYDLNSLSTAILIKYAGREIVLGGDCTYQNWLAHKRKMDKVNNYINAIAVKLPHHGSKKDCKSPIIEHLYPQTGSKYGLISANGKSHPHPDTIKDLSDNSILPYCTNLASICGTNIEEMLCDNELDPTFRRELNSMLVESSSTTQACQGNILVQISEDSEVTVTPEYNHYCPYHTNYFF
jgi:beta-lactamase superfamily II metal-dependent hydrolase